ncbi:MAG: IPT/TIG domain-containing protein, partial [Nevskia sp.]|nr:IPT/TIG domain-containing protein [Nevskia sp.]
MKNGLRSALIGLLLTATSISPLLLPATATAAVITYAQPYIAGFTPTSGPVGTVITVNGKGFTGANVAFIGAAHNVTVRIVSDAQLQMTVPTNATTGQIAILNPKSAAFSPQAYTLTVATAPVPTPAPTPAPAPAPAPA